MTAGRSNLVDVEATLVHETEKAYLLRPHGPGKEAWVPKSVVERNDDGTWTMPEPFATEKGLI